MANQDFSDFDKMFGEPEVPFSTNETPTEAPAQAPVQQAPQPVTPPPVKQETAVAKQQGGSVSKDYEITFSSEMESSLESMGISVGDIGVKISKVPIERYKASTSKVDRISFITKRVIPVKFHFVEGVGSIICFKGRCCDVAGVPNVRYLFPIAVYQTDSEGNVCGKNIELKILSAGEDLYKSIITINKGTAQYGGIDHADLLVTCTDDQFQKISLTFAGPAIWRQYRQIAEFLAERLNRDGTNAYMAIARKVDEATFNKLLHLDESGVDDADSNSFKGGAEDLSKFFE